MEKRWRLWICILSGGTDWLCCCNLLHTTSVKSISHDIAVDRTSYGMLKPRQYLYYLGEAVPKSRVVSKNAAAMYPPSPTPSSPRPGHLTANGSSTPPAPGGSSTGMNGLKDRSTYSSGIPICTASLMP